MTRRRTRLVWTAGAAADLQATLLFGFFQRRLMEPWLRLNERAGGRVPSLVRDPRVQRGWALLMSLVLGLLYWFSGTAAGYTWLQHNVR